MFPYSSFTKYPSNPPPKPRKFPESQLPPSSIKQIVNYFSSNNFQDFNAWQQISKSKVDIGHSQNLLSCHIVLRFDDKQMPTFSVRADGKNKKQSKRKALQKLIIEIAEKGLIGLGFKESNFMQKIQSKKREHGLLREQGIADDEQKLQRYQTLCKLVNTGKGSQAIDYLCKESLNLKSLDSRQVSVVWFEILKSRDIKTIVRFIRRLHNIHDELIPNIDANQCKLNQMLFKEYGFKRKIVDNVYQAYDHDNYRYYSSLGFVESIEDVQVRNPFDYDLDEVMELYEVPSQFLVSKEMEVEGEGSRITRKVEVVADPLPVPLIVPTYQDNHLLIPEGVDLSIVKGKSFPMFPPPILPMMGVHPLLAAQFIQHKHYLSQISKSFLVPPPQFAYRIPCFQKQSKTTNNHISLKTLQTLYECLFYLPDLNYSLQISQLIYSLCSLDFHQKQDNIHYYLNRKNQLVCEFLENIHFGMTNKLATSFYATGVKTLNRNKQQVFHFNPAESLAMNKIAKKNINEFEEMYEITKGQFVLISNQSYSCIGYIKQINPIIVVCPWIKQQEEIKCKITKLMNKKIYDKITEALISVSLETNLLTLQNLQLFWQIPGTSKSFLYETLIEWINKNHYILIVSSNTSLIQQQLTNFKIKYLKLNSKMDEKSINQSNIKIILATVSSCCSDSLKSIKFTHVIIEEANQVSELMCLMPISKGCQYLVMIGDFMKSKPMSVSKLAVSKGIAVSMFERMGNEGNPILCYKNQKRMHYSIADYISRKFYDGMLETVKEEQFISTVKGFSWPAEEIKMCLIHCDKVNQINTVNKQSKVKYSIKQAEIVLKIFTDVIKAGFTKLNDISIIVHSEQQRMLLKLLILKTIKPLISKEQKQQQSKILDVVTTFNNNKNVEKDLIIFNSEMDEENKEQDPVKLNIAMSKALKGFILVGDLKKLSRRKEYRDLVIYGNENRIVYKIDV